MNPLIIDRPGLQSSSQRMIYPVITFAFWLLWIYIWLPLVSLVAWGFGVQLFYDEMILESGLEAFTELAGTYGVVIVLMGASLISWALYNWKRFVNKERRSDVFSLTRKDLAEYFEVNADEIASWHDSKSLVVHHNEHGDIKQVDVDHKVKIADNF